MKIIVDWILWVTVYFYEARCPHLPPGLRCSQSLFFKISFLFLHPSSSGFQRCLYYYLMISISSIGFLYLLFFFFGASFIVDLSSRSVSLLLCWMYCWSSLLNSSSSVMLFFSLKIYILFFFSVFSLLNFSFCSRVVFLMLLVIYC